MPTWEIAYLFPPQGMWSEEEYLSLSTNRLVEFSDGTVEVLPMPTEFHQLILLFLLDSFRKHIEPRDLGKILFAPLRVRTIPGKIREPDILFLLAANSSARGNDYWRKADLVVEIVSDDDRRRDLETKRFEYAQAGFPEYWIVDPRDSRITVLTLVGDRYLEHGVFTTGQRASSVLLPGFEVDVTQVFAVK
jgi:Uma2 family endonuclease